MAAAHPVGPVEFAGLVDQHRPRQTGLANVGFDDRSALKGHDQYADAQLVEFIAMLLQLQQVFATRQSTEMAVKYQQQPPTGEICRTTALPFKVGKFESGGCGALSVHFDCVPLANLWAASPTVGAASDDNH